MSKSIKFLATNKLVNSKHYPDIIREYNHQYEQNGVVEGKKFFNEVVNPLLPDYKLMSWYQFLRKFKNHAGLIYVDQNNKPELKSGDRAIEESKLTGNMLSNQDATASGINAALNLGSKYMVWLLKKYEEDPDTLNPAERKIAAEAMHKAMKSQDSRINAIGKVREDNREEEKLHRVFQEADYN